MNALAGGRLEEFVQAVAACCRASLAPLDSPIEEALHTALLLVMVRDFEGLVQDWSAIETEAIEFDLEVGCVRVRLQGPQPAAMGNPRSDLLLCLIPQCKIGRYRADLVLRMQRRGRPESATLVVECDGHDYHSSKEQLAHDRKRDRWMAGQGLTVFRFTGSEIRADDVRCARECIEQLIGVIEDAVTAVEGASK